MRFVSILAAGALLLSTGAYAAVVQLDKEIAAAATHAGLAAQSEDLAQVRMHLHHTMNCLVGPKGKGYSSKDMDPCSALGNGALVDAAVRSTIVGVNTAIAGTNKALAEEDLTKAKAMAGEVNTLLLNIK